MISIPIVKLRESHFTNLRKCWRFGGFKEFYQEALGEGKVEGMQEGEVLGRQKGEANLVIRQLNRRFEEIPQNLREKILAMSIEQLENLGESLLDFESLSNLVNWLDR